MAIGCANEPPAAAPRKERYGQHYDDFKRIREKLLAFSKDKAGKLSPAEVEEMLALQAVDNPVSVEATALLAAVAHRGDEKLKARLLAAIPRLAANPSPHVNQSALSLAKWFKAEEHRATFQTLLAKLQAKPSKSDAEQVLTNELEQYLKDQTPS